MKQSLIPIVFQGRVDDVGCHPLYTTPTKAGAPTESTGHHAPDDGNDTAAAEEDVELRGSRPPNPQRNHLWLQPTPIGKSLTPCMVYLPTFSGVLVAVQK